MDLKQNVALVGLMGAGKSRVGMDLARLFGVPFVDADREIEKAAGCAISDFFEQYGEEAFREGERRVIERLLTEQKSPCVLATGGGAFIQDETRSLILSNAISVWIKADLDVLVERTAKTGHRPLLKNTNRRDVLQQLMAARYPIYEKAHITVETEHIAPRKMARRIADQILAFQKKENG